MTTAAELGFAPVFLPNGEQVWVNRNTVIEKASSYARQASAVTSLDALAKELGTGGSVVQGPGVPMLPANPAGTNPRLWNYPIGYNIQTQPRAYEGFSFAALRALSYGYDVARLCIEERKARIRRLKWHIQAKPVADMPRSEAKSRAADLAGAVQTVTGFFLSPDQETDFSSWLMEWLELTFSIDAACLYRWPSQGGSMYALTVVDGSTIKVVVDEFGRIPQPPLPAYDQVYLGVVQGQYTSNEMLYRPYWMRPDSPYGSPPIEWVVLAVNRALRRQTRDLSDYTEGNVPVGFLRVSENIPATQLKDMQDMFEELLSGNDLARSRFRVVPGGTGTGFDLLTQPPTTEAEQNLAILTCAAYGVDPKSIGFMTGTGHSMGGKGMEEGIETRGIDRDAEICNYLALTINQVIAEDLGQPELEFVFEGLEQAENEYSKAQAEDLRIRNGSLTINQAMEDHDLDPIGISVPFVVAGQTVILATDIAAASALATQPAPPPAQFGGAPAGGSSQPGTKADLPTANAEPGKATTDGSSSTTKAAADELRAWRTKAIRKGAGIPFETHAISPTDAERIRLLLGDVSSPEQIRAVFAKAGGAPADPFVSPPLAVTSTTGSSSSSPASGRTRAGTSRSGWAL